MKIQFGVDGRVGKRLKRKWGKSCNYLFHPWQSHYCKGCSNVPCTSVHIRIRLSKWFIIVTGIWQNLHYLSYIILQGFLNKKYFFCIWHCVIQYFQLSLTLLIGTPFTSSFNFEHPRPLFSTKPIFANSQKLSWVFIFVTITGGSVTCCVTKT